LSAHSREITMVLGLSVEDRFHNELLSLPRDVQKKVVRAVKALREDPHYSAKPLEGVPGVWRCKIHPYRILFAFGNGWLHVFSVKHRSTVYRGAIATPTARPVAPLPAIPSVDLVEPESAPEFASEPSDDATVVTKLPWDAVGQVVISQESEDLYPLIDFGLPEPLFDELFTYLSNRPKSARGPSTVTLVRQDVIDAFFGKLLRLTASSQPLELTLSSPWITPWSGPKSSLDALLVFLRKLRTRTTLITRTPELPQHKDAVDQLIALKNVEVIFLDDLHAKFFICDIAPAPFCLICSANITAQSYSNFEVGVFVRGSGDAEVLVRELQTLAIDFRATGKRIKRMGTV
jgi:mRNA-degrading endonuclease RelE of RelBE toxin-antitoxin system